MGFNQAPALPYCNLGIAQDGDTASRAIPKDKYVIWKGGNYFAKTDILQGETFVVDTNLTEVPDGAINGLAEALSASLNRVDLLYQETIPTAEAYNITIPNLKNYKFIYIEYEHSTNNTSYNPMIIPVEILTKTTTRCFARRFYWDSNFPSLGYDIKYVDDSTLYFDSSISGWKLTIYGICLQ